MRVHEFLIILFTIGLLALQPGEGTLHCYECKDSSCKEQQLQMCDVPNTTTTNPTDVTSTETTPASTESGSSTSGITSTKPKSTTPTSTEPKSTTPTSSEPKSTTPTSSEPKSTTPTSSEPKSTTPTSSEPKSTTPTSSEPKSTTPTSSEPKSTTPTSSEPKSTTPTSSEPKSTTPTSSESNNMIPTSFEDVNVFLDAMNIDRKRRSVIDRFSRIHSVNDNVTYHCYSKTVNGTELKGCTTEEDFCKDKDPCKLCQTDGCNSATSTVVFTSMIFSLAVIVLFVR